MAEQGCSTLPTNKDGRILDRLAGLEEVISPEQIRQVLLDTGRVNGRACPLTQEVMLWVVLAMGLLTHIQKTHQDPRRAEKPAQLRSETPEGVKQELHALSLGHFVVRSLMFEAAKKEHLDVDRLSFTGCFRILQCRLPECDSRTPASLTQWHEGVLAEMLQENTGHRRDRINPRVIKRKMSKWPKKRSRHRHPPALRKRFEDCVVMKT